MIKKLFVPILLLIVLQTKAQEKLGRPFITGDINFALGINENYTLFNDDDEYLLEPSAAFFRLGFGYEFKKKSSYFCKWRL